MRFAPDPSAWGWQDMLAPVAWLKLMGLKLPAVLTGPLSPVVLPFVAFYAVTAGSFFNFLMLCVSHGVAIGTAVGATLAATKLTYRKRTAAGLEELDRERAAFERKMRDDDLAAEHERRRKDIEAEIGCERLRAQGKADAIAIEADARARAFRTREQAEAGSLQAQLAEAREEIAGNAGRITTLEAQLNTSLSRLVEMGKHLSSIAAQGLITHTWGVIEEEGGDAHAAPPPP